MSYFGGRLPNTLHVTKSENCHITNLSLQRQRALLLHYAGEDANEIFDTLIDTYEKACNKTKHSSYAKTLSES
jgi:hypothetical protein